MPHGVGDTPSPDGDDHGGADDEFASVAFDEDFIRSAAIHEPSADERLLAAAKARAEAEARRRLAAASADPDDGALADEPDWDEEGADDGEGYSSAGYRPRVGPLGHMRWHRMVAWVLAVVMGIGVVALTVAAVYRSASSTRQQPLPVPGNTMVETSAEPASPPFAEPMSPAR